MQGRPAGRPAYAVSLVVDKTLAMAAVTAIVACLYERERTGRGQAIEVPMFELMCADTLVEHLTGGTFGPSEGTNGLKRTLCPGRRPCATSDSCASRCRMEGGFTGSSRS